MKKFWKMLLQKKKIIVSFTIVLILWGLAAADSFSNIFVWETFLPEISRKTDNKEEEVKELFEKCQGEGIKEYYEGMGSSEMRNDTYEENIKVWLESGLKESFPDENWEIKEYPEEETEDKKELCIENKSQTISGKVRVYNIKEEKNEKKYIHFAFCSKGREDSIYRLKQIWTNKMKDNKMADYRDYYYRTFCFAGKLTQREQKQAVKQYFHFFGAEKKRENTIEDMENVYGYTDKINDSTIVEGEKINFHIAFAYDEQENNTRIYLATPFLNTDY